MRTAKRLTYAESTMEDQASRRRSTQRPHESASPCLQFESEPATQPNARATSGMASSSTRSQSSRRSAISAAFTLRNFRSLPAGARRATRRDGRFPTSSRTTPRSSWKATRHADCGVEESGCPSSRYSQYVSLASRRSAEPKLSDQMGRSARCAQSRRARSGGRDRAGRSCRRRPRPRP